MTINTEVDLVNSLDELIRKTWSELKDRKDRAIWWHEQSVVSPFYANIEKRLNSLNKSHPEFQILLVPEYATKPSSYAKKIGTKYPKLKNGKTEPPRSKKVDVAIVAFNQKDFENKSKDPKATYWYIEHFPLILLEFKNESKRYLLRRMEEDLEKLYDLQQTYEGIRRVYFCCITDEIHLDEKITEIIDKIGIKNLKLCFGTYKGDKWGIMEP